MIGQVADCNPKAVVVQADATSQVEISSLRIFNGDGSASTITVYCSEGAATSGAGNVIYYNASLAANGVLELTGLKIGAGQKIEVLSGSAAGVVATAFGEAKSAY